MNSTKFAPIWALLISVAVCGLASLYSMSFRYRVEQANKAVNLSAEIDVIEMLGASEGLTLEQSLLKLKESGLNAVIDSEESINTLLSEGRISFGMVAGSDVGADLPAGTTLIQTHETGLVERVVRGIQIRVPGQRVVLQANSKLPVLAVPGLSPGFLRDVSVGLDPVAASVAKANGFRLIARVSNPQGLAEAGVVDTIRWASEHGADIFLPQGDQVLGRRENIPAMIEAMRQTGMLYASPEFVKIGGDSNVLSASPDIVVRLHSAQTIELDRMPLKDAIDRYSRSARERNMRVLLLRPTTLSSPKPLGSFSTFIGKVNNAVVKEGGAIGEAHPFKDSKVPSFLFAVIGLGALPLAWYVASGLFSGRKVLVFALIAALILTGAAVDAGRNYAALMATILFPLGAYIWLDKASSRNIVLLTLGVTGISLIGGLCVAGLLNGLPFFVRAEQFSGVKLAHFLPIFVIGVYFFMRFFDTKAILASPITWGAAFLALAVLVGLAFMATRTGNDNPAGVSGLELKLRSLLDAILVVRPRTKEFMIGHPALIIGIGMLIMSKTKADFPKWLPGAAALLLAVGAIGSTSVVNTMCHLHTPVELSLTRVGVGLISGGILGLVLWTLIKRLIPQAGGHN
ncbi:MAG: hypothetical protein KF784_12365 [Fimbriimonadaceae bacterium]|nr:hypothetical protein [Fimbriimonadaceae bacterium]